MQPEIKISDFLSKSETIAVVGVSELNKKKFGRYIFDQLKTKGYNVIPVNKRAQFIDGEPSYHSISDLPQECKRVIIVTPKTETVPMVEQAIKKGVKNIWIQNESWNSDVIHVDGIDSTSLIHHQCVMMFAQPVGGIHGFHRFLKKLGGGLPN